MLIARRSSDIAQKGHCFLWIGLFLPVYYLPDSSTSSSRQELGLQTETSSEESSRQVHQKESQSSGKGYGSSSRSVRGVQVPSLAIG